MFGYSNRDRTHTSAASCSVIDWCERTPTNTIHIDTIKGRLSAEQVFCSPFFFRHATVDNSAQQAAALIVLIYERFQCCFDGRAFRAIAERVFVQSWVSRNSIVFYSFVVLAAATATITYAFSLSFSPFHLVRMERTSNCAHEYEVRMVRTHLRAVWISHNDCLWAVVLADVLLCLQLLCEQKKKNMRREDDSETSSALILLHNKYLFLILGLYKSLLSRIPLASARRTNVCFVASVWMCWKWVSVIEISFSTTFTDTNFPQLTSRLYCDRCCRNSTAANVVCIQNSQSSRTIPVVDVKWQSVAWVLCVMEFIEQWVNRVFCWHLLFISFHLFLSFIRIDLESISIGSSEITIAYSFVGV